MKNQYTYYFLKIIKSYQWSLLFFLVLIIYSYTMGISKLHLLGQIAVIFLPLLVFAKIRPLNIIIACIISSIISAEYAYFLIFNERISPVILSSASEVTLNMGTKVATPIIKFFIPLFIINSFLTFKITKELKILSIKKIVLSVVACLLVIIIPLSLVIYKYYTNHPNKTLAMYQLKNTPFELLKDMTYIRYPLVAGDTLYLIVNYIELSAVKQNSHHDEVFTGLTLNKNKTTPTKIIVIVGESSVSTHYPLYGYPYNTTPFLTNLSKQQQLLVIQNTIAGSPITRESLRLAFSFASPREGQPFFTHKNLIEMATLADYETLWLSSTIENGLNAKYTGMIAHSSDVFLDANTEQSLRKTEDLGLVPFFAQNYQANKKQLFILHLLGSHMLYSDRYHEKAKALTTTPENTDYDRSIFNTDLFIQQIIEEVNKHDESAVVIYFSDHGEIINKGHGFIYSSADQYKIPFVFYLNPKQKNKSSSIDYNNLINKYRNQEGMFNLTNFSYILAELLGYNIKPELVEEARKDGSFIYHSDGQSYLFRDIESGKMPPR